MGAGASATNPEDAAARMQWIASAKEEELEKMLKELPVSEREKITKAWSKYASVLQEETKASTAKEESKAVDEPEEAAGTGSETASAKVRKRYTVNQAFVDMGDVIPDKLSYVKFGKIMLGEDDETMSEIEAAQKKYGEVVEALVVKFEENWARGLGSESFLEQTFVRPVLQDCLFVGHTATDTDSISSAIAAAELFKGTPLRSEENFNGEIEYVCKFAGVEVPPTFDSWPGGAKPDENGNLKKVCLVDHNEVDQMTPALKNDAKERAKRVVGLIDHHCIANSFCSPSPLFMDVRPWGSACTILTHQYLRNRVPIRKEIARLLLGAILSDTLNLKSGTTTAVDRFFVALLGVLGEVEDIDEIAHEMFKAKTSWIVGLGAYEMIRGDQKNFVAGKVRYSIAVLEVTTQEPVLKISEEILAQLRVFKYEKGDVVVNDKTGEKIHDVNKECHCALLFVVDTVNQKSVALCCGGREKWLLEKSFPGCTFRKANETVRSPSDYIKPEETLCDVGGLCSRKLEFVPMTQKAFAENTLPEYFLAEAKLDGSKAKLVEALKEAEPISYTDKVVWDRKSIMGAIFGPGDVQKLEEAQKMKGIEETPRGEGDAAPTAA